MEKTATVYKSDTKVHKQNNLIKNDFKKVIDKSSKIILRISTVFPFKFFPTKITIDQSKVSIINEGFFNSESIRSITIKDIQYVTAETGVLFGALHIRAFGFEDREFFVNYLRAHEVLKARRIIEGLIVCCEEQIDYSDYDLKSLTKFIELIGAEHLN